MSALRTGRFGALFCMALGLALCAAASHAQKQPRLGVTLAGSPPDPFADALRRGLAEYGWIDGRNISIVYRYANGKPENYAPFMREFGRTGVDVIVAGGGPLAVRAAANATQKIPIVAPAMADPLAAGFVTNLARPGGRVTGLSLMAADTSGKRLELLREAFPKLRRIAALVDPANDFGQQQATERASKAFGFDLHIVTARTPAELGDAFERAKDAGAQALLVLSSGMFNAHRKRLAELAERTRLPVMYPNREFVEAGGLISYGVDIADIYRSSAKYVDRILRGAKPGDLPVEQPTKFELLVNLHAAKMLGIELTRNLVARADQVVPQ